MNSNSKKNNGRKVTLDVRRVPINVPASVNKGLIDEVFFNIISDEDRETIFDLYPGILVHLGNKSYNLAGRHWSYEAQMYYDPHVKFYVYDDAESAQIAVQKEKEEAKMIKKAYKRSRKSRSTKNRIKYLNAGRKCPLCGDALLTSELVSQRKGRPHDKTPYGVACHHCGNKRCFFCTYLTEYEYGLFVENKLRTDDWCREIKGRTCKCGGRLFERIIHHSAVDIERYEICENHSLKAMETCEHINKL